MNDKPDKSQMVRSYFDTIARRYDLMNTLLSFGLHHAWKRTAVAHAGITDSMRVLDVCGGTGDLATLAARRLNERGMVAVYDFSREMLRAGRSRARQRAAVTCVCGDAQLLAVQECCIDVVLIGFGLRNLTDMHAGLRELYRVLKPDGRLICLEFSQPAGALLRRLYDLYSYRVIPVLGALITGSRDAYTYLPDSIRAFPAPNRLQEMIEHTGFTEVSYSLLTGGIAAVHTGRRT